MIDNMAIEKNRLLVSVNPALYPIEVIYFAAYRMMEQFFVSLSGEPEQEIFAQFIPRKQCAAPELEQAGREFNNFLIDYAAYLFQSDKTLALRHLIMQKAFFTDMNEENMQDIRPDIARTD